MKLAIVTACPSGIANSIIAAGLLEKASKELNWQVNIECHSSIMPVQALTSEQIEEAEEGILASVGEGNVFGANIPPEGFTEHFG